ncbi:cobalamin biosynthesis protein CbiG [Paraburkholderia silviterrae]|uniref:Cobalamin biosynthesis protein CbiG n=1 Tax=Paraburkholderia silviterrae TaxID=2528715 RepID=A0A4R5M8M5_9BURK|nr:cobalamin biosynthesis protein CbiG [Paraburkholderia silviterrae]
MHALASTPCNASRSAHATPSNSRIHVNRSLPADALPTAPASVHNPAPLALGLGCRSGVTLAQVEATVHAALGAWPLARVKTVATLDAKAAEPALLAFCARHALPLQAFARENVNAMGMQSGASVAAHARFGVQGVCEPCAQLAALGGPLVRGKLALDGVTVAIAAFAEASQADAQTAAQAPT